MNQRESLCHRSRPTYGNPPCPAAPSWNSNTAPCGAGAEFADRRSPGVTRTVTGLTATARARILGLWRVAHPWPRAMKPIVRAALAQLHQVQGRERKLLRQLGESRQREAAIAGRPPTAKEDYCCPDDGATPCLKCAVKAERRKRPNDDAFRPPMKRHARRPFHTRGDRRR